MRYFLVLVAVNLMWAMQFSGVKFATEMLGPVTVVLITLVISVVLLAPLTTLEKSRGGVDSRWLLRLMLLGFGAVVSQVGMTWGVERSLASHAAVLNLTIPVMTAIFASFLLSEKMTTERWIAFVLALGGTTIVSGLDWRSLDLFHNRYAGGNALIMAGCCGSAFYNTYSKKLLERYGPIQVLTYSFAAAAALLAPVAIATEHPTFGMLSRLDWRSWASILAIAIFSLSLSMVLFLWVIDKIDVTRASLSIYLLPVLGVIISAVTLHERVTWQLLAGGVLVFASTFLVTIYEERNKAAAAPQTSAEGI